MGDTARFSLSFDPGERVTGMPPRLGAALLKNKHANYAICKQSLKSLKPIVSANSNALLNSALPYCTGMAFNNTCILKIMKDWG
ncbi:MAG: hypothetical protein EOO38_26895 [Cytophagaceae bacterium]|nr:MAG: hypothetical protein EOO38_26895 [Cytophagaceae bacterium]